MSQVSRNPTLKPVRVMRSPIGAALSLGSEERMKVTRTPWMPSTIAQARAMFGILPLRTIRESL